ncbi:hypothetical protein [Nocardia amamiensis]|uniref:hypothetical protein n=1 Tax=Nocardia amamiensis TaxID=404578 RepID=UPI00340A7991
MRTTATMGAAVTAAAAVSFLLPSQATADPLSDLLCAMGSAQFCLAPPIQPGPGCHPSYDPCLPMVSDVDCEGGGGDGPVYTGRVRVIGPDEYGLDRDGDGVGCDTGD